MSVYYWKLVGPHSPPAPYYGSAPALNHCYWYLSMPERGTVKILQLRKGVSLTDFIFRTRGRSSETLYEAVEAALAELESLGELFPEDPADTHGGLSYLYSRGQREKAQEDGRKWTLITRNCGQVKTLIVWER